jgi:pentachlorophenol monooxygenase/3-(3-hydroxy-phenyl)propionate hydroxylase
MNPVVVIGNGPVGQTTALLLARWGVPVVVLDQRAARDPVGSKAICQQRDVLDVWESVGAGARIAAEGVTWTTARTFHRGAELFSYAFADGGRSPFPPFVNISQSRTEEILDECVAAQPLVHVRWGQRVVSVAQDAAGVALTCGDGSRVRAAYVVACPGARCDELRALLGVRFAGHSFDDRFLICDIRTDLPGWATERRFHFDPGWNSGRQVLVHPCPDSTFRIDWQVPSGYDLDAEAVSGALDRRIRAVIGDRPYEIVWKSVYRFHSRCADRMRVGRSREPTSASTRPAGCPASGMRRGRQRGIASGGCCWPAMPRTCTRRSERAGSTPGWPTPRTRPGRSRSWPAAGRARSCWRPITTSGTRRRGRTSRSRRRRWTSWCRRPPRPLTIAVTCWPAPRTTPRPGRSSTRVGWPSRSGTWTRR